MDDPLTPQTGATSGAGRHSGALPSLEAALVDSDEVILRATTEDEVFGGMCRVIAANLGLPLVWVGLAEPGTRRLRVNAAAGAKVGYLEEAGFTRDGLMTAGNIVSRALRTGLAQVMSDLAAGPAGSPAAALARTAGFRSAASFPIRSGHTVIGALQCTSDEPGYFSEQIVGLLGRLAASASTMVAYIEHERRRREVEQHLTEGRQRQHGLFDLAPVAIMVLWVDRVEVNDALLDMFGYPDQASFDAAGPLAIVDPADPAARRQLTAFLQMGPGESRMLQTTGRRTDGSTFPLLLERVALDEIDASTGVVFLTDLTGLENAEASSRRSRARLNAILDNSPVGLLSLDLDGIIRTWNPAAARMFGRTEAQAVGYPGPGGRVATKDIRLMTSGEAPHLRGELVAHTRADQTTVDLRISTASLNDSSGQPSELLVVAEDVTDLNRLDAERARMATAIDQSSEAIVITDATAAIQYVNPAFERATGYSRAQAIGKNPRILQSGVHPSSFYKAMWAILGRGETWRGTFVNRARDGRLIEAEAAISPVFDASGRLINYVAVQRDVSRERAADLALRRSEERYRKLVDFANDAIFIREPGGRFLEANRTACERLGYSREQLLAMAPADIDSTPATLSDRTEAIVRQGSAIFETVQIARDGTAIPTEISSTVIDYAGRKAILSIARDITERKLAEAALRDSELRFRTLIEQAPVAISVSRDGVGLYANRKFVEMFGLQSDEETVGRPVSDYLEDKAASRERVRRRKLGIQVPAEWETVGIRADGTRFPLSVALVQVELPNGPANVAYVTDITQRKSAEAAHAAAEAERAEALTQQRAIFDSLGDGVAIIDFEGNILEVNQALCDMLGYTRDQMLSMPFEHVSTPATASLIHERMDATRAGGVQVFDSVRLGSDGTEVPVETSARFITFRGQPAILTVQRDIRERLRAEEEIKQSRTLLRSIIDSTPDAVYVKDPQGRYLLVNAATERIVGKSADEILGKDDAALFPAAEAATIMEADRREMQEPGPRTWEENLTTSTGATATFWSTKGPIRRADGSLVGLFGIARDVTERTRILKALELSEAKFSTAFKTSPDSVNINRLSDGLFLEVSDGFTEITGFTREDVEGRTSADIAIWADPGTRERVVGMLRADGVVRNLEIRFRRKDGSVGTGLISGRLIEVDGEECFLSIMGDISERKAADERFRTLFDLANDAIVISEPGGRFIEVNRTAYERLGYSRDELLAMSPADISVPEQAALAQERTAAILSHGSAFFETAHVCRDGRVIPVQVSSTLIELGGRKAILSVARDVSALKEAEKERAVLEEQLHQAAKEEVIGRLAGGIAHDFNNLLTAIRGNASLALAELPSGAGPREDIEQIVQAADRAAALTRQLLAFARRTVLDPRVVDLGEIVRRLEPMLRRLLGEDVTLMIHTPNGLNPVMADPGKIEQVIVNLAVNARDAMPGGGVLTIEVAESSDHSTPRKMTTLSVVDTGIGMDAATLGHLIEPFFTTKGPGRGTGLGLAMVHGIVRQSGGTVTATSKLGMGSTFTISLPSVERPSGSNPQPGVAATAPKRGSGTVLLVEDDAAVRRFAGRVLERAGYRVLTASAGSAAIALASEEKVDMLVTDVVMPGMSGPEVAQAVTARNPNCRVLLMTGHTNQGIVRDAVLDPNVRLIAKPFAADALLAVVHAALIEREGS